MSNLCYICNKNDKYFYTSHVIYDVDINNFDKIFNDYIISVNKKYKLEGFIFNNINKMIINTISCRCNMTYMYYLSKPMSMTERGLNFHLYRDPKINKISSL